MSIEDRERLRQECHDLEGMLRGEPGVPESAFRLFEIILLRLDRLETGSFSNEERPTEPERKSSSAHFRAVGKALEEGKKKDGGE